MQNKIVQHETVYNEVDKNWNYICNISNIRNFKKIYDEGSKTHKLTIIYKNGSDVSITNINTEYFMKFLYCVSRYKNQKEECDFLILTEHDVWLLTDINYQV